MLYPCSALASRDRRDKRGRQVRDNCHNAFLVEASSIDEARGKAVSVALKRFPKADGWFDHDTDVATPGLILTEANTAPATEG